jgi:hypothetical protein
VDGSSQPTDLRQALAGFAEQPPGDCGQGYGVAVCLGLDQFRC